MRQTQQAAARSHARRTHLRVRLARGVAVLLLGCIALPAWSATVKDVRLGRHPEFTRVVFELDEQAGYRVKRSHTELVITVDAATKAWKFGRQGSIDSVVVEAGDEQSVARIQLRQSGLRLQEMILANPPRIVLDLMHPATAATAKPSTPKPKPAVKEPAPEPAVKKPAPTPVAQPAPKPVPKPEPAPKPAVEPPPPPPPSVAQPEPERSLEEDLLAAPPSSFVKAAEPEKPKVEPTPEPAKPLVAPARTEPKPAKKKKKKVADTSPGLLRNPMVIGAAVAALIVVIALVVILRRRRAIPNDMDFDDMDDDESDAGEAMAAEAAEEDDFFGDLDDSSAQSAPAEVAKPVPQAPPSSGSIFDEEESKGDAPETQGDTAMGQDLTGMQAGSGPSPAAGGDIARIVQELQARIESLERNVEEANEARVRLERQVAAQSEELRVQRAAIARTQRALRSMSRSDDDKATEPALKDDAETQMKTRVNG
jgi:hypothetical protein